MGNCFLLTFSLCDLGMKMLLSSRLRQQRVVWATEQARATASISRSTPARSRNNEQRQTKRRNIETAGPSFQRGSCFNYLVHAASGCGPPHLVFSSPNPIQHARAVYFDPPTQTTWPNTRSGVGSTRTIDARVSAAADAQSRLKAEAWRWH